MRTHFVKFFVILCVLAPFLAHAGAQFPDSNKLRPTPAGVHPSVSQSVNYAVPASTDVIVLPGDQSAPEQGTASTTVPQGTPRPPILIISLVCVLALACLVFAWRMLRE